MTDVAFACAPGGAFVLVVVSLRQRLGTDLKSKLVLSQCSFKHALDSISELTGAQNFHFAAMLKDIHG